MCNESNAPGCTLMGCTTIIGMSDTHTHTNQHSVCVCVLVFESEEKWKDCTHKETNSTSLSSAETRNFVFHGHIINNKLESQRMADVWNGRIFHVHKPNKTKKWRVCECDERERETSRCVRGQLKSKRAAAYLTNKARRWYRRQADTRRFTDGVESSIF